MAQLSAIQIAFASFFVLANQQSLSANLHATSALGRLCAMDFSIESLHSMENDFALELQNVLKTAKVTSMKELNETTLLRLNKNPLAEITLRLVNLYEKSLNTCKSAAVKMDQLKTEQIENQKKLLQIHGENMDSVQQTVKTELKSWSDVVKKGIPNKQLTAKTVKEAVRSVTDEEKRSKCFMIYGFEEKESASDDCDPFDIAKNVYRKTCGLSPKIMNSYRIGSKTNGKTRPIKVEVEHPALVQGLLQAAHRLRNSNYKSVYIAPDRFIFL